MDKQVSALLLQIGDVCEKQATQRGEAIEQNLKFGLKIAVMNGSRRIRLRKAAKIELLRKILNR